MDVARTRPHQEFDHRGDFRGRRTPAQGPDEIPDGLPVARILQPRLQQRRLDGAGRDGVQAHAELAPFRGAPAHRHRQRILGPSICRMAGMLPGAGQCRRHLRLVPRLEGRPDRVLLPGHLHRRDRRDNHRGRRRSARQRIAQPVQQRHRPEIIHGGNLDRWLGKRPEPRAEDQAVEHATTALQHAGDGARPSRWLRQVGRDVGPFDVDADDAMPTVAQQRSRRGPDAGPGTRDGDD